MKIERIDLSNNRRGIYGQSICQPSLNTRIHMHGIDAAVNTELSSGAGEALLGRRNTFPNDLNDYLDIRALQESFESFTFQWGSSGGPAPLRRPWLLTRHVGRGGRDFRHESHSYPIHSGFGGSFASCTAS